MNRIGGPNRELADTGPRRGVGGKQPFLLVLGYLLGSASFVAVAYWLTGYPFVASYEPWLEQGALHDIVHKRATAWEAWYGNPYRSLGEILSDHGIEAGLQGIPPRTPGAYLVHSILLLVPESHLLLFAVTSVIMLTLACLRLSGRIAGVAWHRMLLLSPLVAISLPFATAVSHGSVTVIGGAVLVLVAWAFPERRWAGVALGVAMAIRVWPTLIAFGFALSGRRRLAYEAGASAVVFTLLGLLIPQVTIVGSLTALTQGSDHGVGHPQNASLTALLAGVGVPISLGLAVLTVMVLFLAWKRASSAVEVAALGGLLAVPLSWPAYIFNALPAIVRDRPLKGKVALVLLLTPYLLWAPFPQLITPVAFVASLAGILAIAIWYPRPGGRHEEKVTPTLS